jgi:hypothetical protein
LKVLVLHNITPDFEPGHGRGLAIFERSLRQPRYQQGDSLLHVYTIATVPGRYEDSYALEFTFTLLNINHPTDYRMRSLSVGDVAIVDRTMDGGVARAYFCDSIGWEEIRESFAYIGGQTFPPVMKRFHFPVDLREPRWVIQSAEGEEVLFWTNENGWGGPATAERFTDTERKLYQLPVGGRWYSAAALDADLRRAADPDRTATDGRFADRRDDS